MSGHTPARINPDRGAVIALATTTAVGLAAASFALSFAGLVAVAAWAGVTSCLGWLVPVMIDGAIGVYTLAVLVQRARHESTVLAWSALSLWTAVSVLGNAAHGYAPPADVRRLVGTVVVGLAPVAVLLAIHTIADLTIARPAPATPATGADAAPAPVPAVPDAPAPVAEPEPLPAPAPAAPAPVAAPRGTERLALVPAPTAPRSPAPETAARNSEIARLHAAGMQGKDIAVQLGVSKSTVSRVLSRNTPTTIEGVPA